MLVSLSRRLAATKSPAPRHRVVQYNKPRAPPQLASHRIPRSIPARRRRRATKKPRAMAPALSSPSPAAPHVAVVAFPFSSHAAVLLSFARAVLASAAAPPGTTLSFLSTATSIAQLRDGASGSKIPTSLRFVELPDGRDDRDVEKVVPIPRRMEMFMAAAEAGGVKAALEAAAGGGARVTCVVGDAFVWPAADAAAEVGAPWVPVWTAASSALLAHVRTDALRDDVADQAARRADELLTSHPGLASYRVRDLPDGVVDGDFNYVISQLVHRMGQRLPRLAAGGAVALNAFPGLDPPDVTAALADLIPAQCLPIGPYHLLSSDSDHADPHGCIAYLDRHPARAVAYVSFGTVASPRPDELRELATGLESSGAPFLWSLREDSWPLLPTGFLDRGTGGLVVPWAPQVAVLRHGSVGAFVTHAGWNSVVEAVSGGVPMVCRPFFGDQRMNARSVADVWGFGTAFDDGPMTRAAVAEAVRALLRGEQGARTRARAQELQAMVVKAFRPGGECRNNFDKFVHIVCRVEN